MVDLGLNGIILRVKNNALGEAWDIPVLGKTLEGWAAAALNAQYTTVDASPVINLADKLKAAVDKTKPVTVALYCDTPLVNRKTVEVAVKQLVEQKLNMIKLPRG